MAEVLRAPFPWFGGKSRAAHLIWERFGDVANYIEPFAGSLAVLLARPTEPRIETVNDLDCYVANFWRATQADPEAVAKWADWPVNEADLHARHRWLVAQRAEHRERMMNDPHARDMRSPDLYSVETEVSSAVRAWAIENGEDSRLRIALCGYEGEHEMPASWKCVPWKSTGTREENAKRERIWFSPHCLKPTRQQPTLF